MFAGDAFLVELVDVRVGSIEGAEDRVPRDCQGESAFIELVLGQLARDHADVDCPGQRVGDAFACSAGRDINADFRMQALVFIGPLGHQRIERKSAGNGYSLVRRGGLAAASAEQQAEKEDANQEEANRIHFHGKDLV